MERMSQLRRATRLLQAPPGVGGRSDAYFDNQREIVYDGPEGQVTTMISVSLPRQRTLARLSARVPTQPP